MACYIDRDTECPTVGEIEDLHIGKSVFWHIPNILSMPSSVDFGVNSPEFTFANATWCLQMYPCGQRLRESENFVDLQVVRLESLVEKHEGDLIFDVKMAQNTKIGDFSVEDEDLSSYRKLHFLVEPNRCVCGETSREYYRVVSHKDFVPPHDCFLVHCRLLMKDIADPISQPFGSTTRTTKDHQWFSVGDCDENPTVGVTEDYDEILFEWSFPVSSHIFKNAGIQSPPFSARNATWCLRFRCCEEDGTAKFAVVRMSTAKRRNQKLSVACGIQSLNSRNKSKKLKRTMKNCAVVKKTDSELDICTFKFSQRSIKSSVAALAVICTLRLEETAAGDAESEPELAGSVEGVYKLLGDLKRLLLTSEGSDVTLLVQGQNFSVHSAILRARSSVFNSMLNCDMKEKKTGKVDIEDCDPGTFKDFLHFLYCGSVEDMSSENVFSLYRAADKYDVQDLKSQCVAFMRDNLTEDTFCDTIALSLQQGEKELLKLATEFFAKNYQRIILTVQWQEFITGNPIQCNELFIKALVSDSASKK